MLLQTIVGRQEGHGSRAAMTRWTHQGWGTASAARLAGGLAALGCLLTPSAAAAYIGPGAGFAVITSFVFFLGALALTLLSLLAWPLRQVLRRVRTQAAPRPARVERAVVIGLDGLDPRVARRLMEAGRMPHLSRLAELGGFGELATTCPAMSPVAWSSFATGVDPSKHSIFDFLTRDRRSYRAKLSSAEVLPAARRARLGRWSIPLSKPSVRMLRRGVPFWKTLAHHRVPCSIVRVPVTFPPDEFDGTMLSAMCVPDLQGTQGTFSVLEVRDAAAGHVSGQSVPLVPQGDGWVAELPGPEHPLLPGRSLTSRIELRPAKGGGLTVVAGRRREPLTVDANTPWITLRYPVLAGLAVQGIARFRLLDGDPPRVYVTPVQIDPARPALPISHPVVFSVFLSKLIGPFATTGLAEDTWALNEDVIDEEAFLEQAHANHAEREAMLFELLDRTPKGLLACVFDATDRIQHMFMRYTDPGHPSLERGRAAEQDEATRQRYAGVIDDTYVRMDAMIGEVCERVDPTDPDNLVAVISDHGFSTFRWGVNLNAWLAAHGWLVFEEGRQGCGEWFEGVDWSRTKAFALGLSGIYLNRVGRESRGVVPRDGAAALVEEIGQALTGLSGPEGEAVRRVVDPRKAYAGPFMDDAPDIIVGYTRGHRASWDSVRGLVRPGAEVFEPNTKAWSGDHCIDPDEVPGVIATNRRLQLDGAGIADVAPTLLDLFGVPTPRHMDGRSLAPPAA